jgi:hypothetical protein
MSAVTYLSGEQMLRGIKRRGLIAGRLRDILNGLLVEFPVRTRVDEILIRQAATLAVVSERLQVGHTNGELLDLRIVRASSKMLRWVLNIMRERNGQRGPAPASIHERLASFHETLDADDARKINELLPR